MNNNPLDSARNLAYCILNSKEYSDLIEAEEQYLGDNYAINLVRELNNSNICSLNEIQKKIDNNTTIQNLYECQNEYKKLLKNIDNIVKFITSENERVNINLIPNSQMCGGCCKK